MPDFVNYNNTDIESNLLVDNNSPGLMSSDDKKKLNGLPGVWYGSEKEYDNLETKDSNVLYIIKPPLTTTLSYGSFSTILKTIGPNATNLIFTKTAIPSDKISSATIVSTEDSDVNAYMYLDGDTIYVSPEEDNAIIYANENCSFMFNDCHKLISLDVSNFNTSKVTSMSNMFNSCSALTSLDLSNFNTSKVTSMSNMFNSCSALTSLDVSNFNTSNVTSMSNMFNNCRALTSLDVSNFDTSKVTSMGYMFSRCGVLSGSITITNPNITSYSRMFNYCSTNAGSKFTVNYKSGCQTVAQKMVNTRSSNSNVVLGVQV